MPVVHRQRLAARLRQNWYAMHPPESTADQPTTTTTAAMFPMVDDSLTSLAWLQNLNVMKLASSSSSSSNAAAAAAAPRSVSIPGTPVLGENTRRGSGHPSPAAAYRRGLSAAAAAAAAADDDDGLTRLRVDPNEVLDMTNRQERSPSVASGGRAVAVSPWNAAPSATASSRAGGGGGGDGGVFDEAASAAGQLERDRYRYDGSMKPPYSYATLICMAMQETPDRRITLAQIYNWISDNFAFYRQADQNWQHSIRHNLSLNKCFQKVPRGKDEPGKGGFWTLNPDFSSLVDKGIFKKRRLAFSCYDSSSSGLGPKKDSNAAGPSPKSHRSVLQGPASKQTYPAAAMASSSKENVRISDPILDFRTDSLADVLDLHWALSQNIDVGGLSVKTEDIIDDMHLPSSSPSSSSAAALFAAAAAMGATGDLLLLDSPPPSSDSDSELELNSLLNFSALHPAAAAMPSTCCRRVCRRRSTPTSTLGRRTETTGSTTP